MKLRRFRSVLTLSLAVGLCFSASSSFAATADDKAEVKAKPEFVRKADEILKQTPAGEERVRALQEEGWELVDSGTDSENLPLSSPGCGSVTNESVLKHWDGTTSRWMYLIQANWDFSSSCLFDNTSEAAFDYLAIAVIDQSNAAVNAQAEYAQIYVRDEDGDVHSSAGAVSSYNAAGVAYTIADNDGLADNVGDNGEAWFYITQPTSGTSYYVRSQWTHTWNSTNTTLTGLTIGYQPPNAVTVGATWANNVVPLSWTVADQDYVTFP
jgi:hypothetical protein